MTVEEVITKVTVSFDPMPGRKKVADAIEKALQREGKDQKDLADASGVGASTISDLLKQRQNLTVPVAARLGAVPWLKLSAKKLMSLALDEE
jgi:plasmid maintenance system antidote protein VapI